jgi:hypothetical protein
MTRKKLIGYKDIQIVHWCKKCGALFRPSRGYSHLGLCIVCRREFIRDYNIRTGNTWKEKVAKMTPERREEFMEKEYLRWQNWVNDHLPRRRSLALESYHRRKDDPGHRARSHHKKKTTI